VPKQLPEVNPRVSGSLVANLGAGVNMLEISLKEAYGLPYEVPELTWGATMYRYYTQFFNP
jgi:hypothetical protein